MECDVPEPVSPEVVAWLHHLAHERLQRRFGMKQRRFGMKPPPPNGTSTEDRSWFSNPTTRSWFG